jgi:hypothetical protein
MVDNGLVFEINRKVLHPLGLALIADVAPDNRRSLAITALLETSDEEGFLYDEESLEDNENKFEKFMRTKGSARIEARQSKLGFVIQGDGNEGNTNTG